jgi:hypothetical protein
MKAFFFKACERRPAMSVEEIQEKEKAKKVSKAAMV